MSSIVCAMLHVDLCHYNDLNLYQCVRKHINGAFVKRLATFESHSSVTRSSLQKNRFLKMLRFTIATFFLQMIFQCFSIDFLFLLLLHIRFLKCLHSSALYLTEHHVVIFFLYMSSLCCCCC